MDIFSPHSRLIDRMAYQYPPTIFLFKAINMLMGWRGHGMKEFTGFHKHAKARNIFKTLNKSTYDEYYKFVFVRNPYDFLVSHYHYILQTHHHMDYNSVSKMSFSEFLEWHIDSKPALQIDFIMDKKRKVSLVDYVGRFETLKEDIKYICRTLSIDPAKKVKHKNRSKKRKRKNFQAYYTETDRKRVEDYFHLDLAYLGYEFDGSFTSFNIPTHNQI